MCFVIVGRCYSIMSGGRRLTVVVVVDIEYQQFRLQLVPTAVAVLHSSEQQSIYRQQRMVIDGEEVGLLLFSTLPNVFS